MYWQHSSPAEAHVPVSQTKSIKLTLHTSWGSTHHRKLQEFPNLLQHVHLDWDMESDPHKSSLAPPTNGFLAGSAGLEGARFHSPSQSGPKFTRYMRVFPPSAKGKGMQYPGQVDSASSSSLKVAPPYLPRPSKLLGP